MKPHAIRDFSDEMTSLGTQWDWRTALKGAGIAALVGGVSYAFYRVSLFLDFIFSGFHSKVN